jgi:hypothetical protein
MPRVWGAGHVGQASSIGDLGNRLGLLTLGLCLDLFHFLHRLKHLKEQVKGKQARVREGKGGCEELAGERAILVQKS